MPLPLAIWAAAAAGAAGAAAWRRIQAGGVPHAVDGAATVVRERAAAVTTASDDEVAARWARLLDSRLTLGAAVDDWMAGGGVDVDHALTWVANSLELPLALAGARAAKLRGQQLAGETVVAGITGSGKSTLVNAVLGRPAAGTGAGAPVTAGVHRHRSADRRATLVDTEGLELAAGHVREERAAHLTVLASLADVVWYCIQGDSGRVQPSELELLAEIQERRPVIVVLTRTLEASKPLRRAVRASVKDADIVDVLAVERRLGDGTVPASGIAKLTAAHRRAFRRRFGES